MATLNGQTKTRAIETSIDISAPVEAVWRALTDAQELTRWFPLKAEVKPGAGGFIKQAWGDQFNESAKIEDWEPNHKLRLVYDQAMGAGDGRQISIEMNLEKVAGGTRLRLVHDGFGLEPEHDGIYDGTVRGWAFELRGLKHYLEHHVGTPRDVVWILKALGDIATADSWRRLLGPEGFAFDDPQHPPPAGSRYETTTATGDRLSGEIRICRPPLDLCATVANWNNAFLRVRIEEAGAWPGAKSELNLWFSFFDYDNQQVGAIKSRWEEAMSALFGK
jgi:uncharacterized protein YndB with AHSA1/START domain